MAKHPAAYQHRHAYVYGFIMQSRHEGKVPIEYVLLTDIDGHNCRQNRLLLEGALRLAYGMYPKDLKFKYEKQII
jgi:hypothetical protein